MAVAFGMAYFLHTSYSYGGVMLIICFYVFNNHHIGRAISNIVFNIGMFEFGVQWWGALSVLPIAFYNKKPGTKKLKYMFYWFYPVHLLILVLVKIYIIH